MDFPIKLSKKKGSFLSLKAAAKHESKQFEAYYSWLQENMSEVFFEEVEPSNVLMLAHLLMGFDLQEHFSHVHLKNQAFVLCLDSPDADLKILKLFDMYGVKSYRTFVSKAPPPFKKIKTNLRIASVFFSEPHEKRFFSSEKKKELIKRLKNEHPSASKDVLEKLLQAMSARFLNSLTEERFLTAVNLFFRAKQSDLCQYEIKRNDNWKEDGLPSLQVILAWKNVPKHNFFYRLAKTVFRHNLVMRRINAVDIDPYSQESYLIMSIGLHGINGKASWEEADLEDFLQELVTVKYFSELDNIEKIFVDTGLIRGNLGNLVKTLINFVHQALVNVNAHLYSFSHVEEAFCRHPELTVKLTEAFEWKFHPARNDYNQYMIIRESYQNLVDRIDTGHETNDTRRKNILRQAMNCIHYTQKTNFYLPNKPAHCFRLDPTYLDFLPFKRDEKFPELPYAIFYMKGLHFMGFHIRFKDLSRGGVRTILPAKQEQYLVERNHIFAECYNLAHTQQKKNKDIPEGGSKGIVFLEPDACLDKEVEIYKRELTLQEVSPEEIKTSLDSFKETKRLEYMHESQRAYIRSFLPLINCNEEGNLRAPEIVDYYKEPEYIYLGPDENMHNEIIEWISDYSRDHNYKPGSSFITSKPGAGINHKEFGVTSLGVNVYVTEMLKHLGIDPYKDPFTIKISGGPDGDVAGNEILNLYKHFPKTAKLLALIDKSGTIYDPNGLDLSILAKLFKEVKPLSYYPHKKLSPGGFLLDTSAKKEVSPYVTQTLCVRKTQAGLQEEWLSGNEMNHLLRHNVHQTQADIFVPCGGRPRTLKESNIRDYLDSTDKPTSKAIVEGANLYLAPSARRALENMDVLIVKDSSANKGGVICSSFEVLAGLILTEQEFLKHKTTFMKEVLDIIEARALEEATLLLQTHAKTQAPLTIISDRVSEKINTFTYELLDYLKTVSLSNNPKDPLIRCLFNYCPPFLRTRYKKRILTEVPDIHKKAIISSHIAARLVYSRGLDWSPSIVDVLPLIAQDPAVQLD